MKLWSKIAAFLLLAIWLPATQHCDLEAAGVGVLTHGEQHASAACADVCTDDACHAIESVSYVKTATADLRVLPPLETLCSCLLCLLTPPALSEREPMLCAVDAPELQALHRTWHFVRRTALPARAPNPVV